jgi:hypothetical protein
MFPDRHKAEMKDLQGIFVVCVQTNDIVDFLEGEKKLTKVEHHLTNPVIFGLLN